MATLLDLLDARSTRYGDRGALALRLDDGSTTAWSYRELDARARGSPRGACGRSACEPGDRMLTWSPSTPELPAAYFGAMRARLVLVPLDLRMSPDAVEGIVQASGARHLILGTGRDAPDPREAGLDHFPTTTVEALVRRTRRRRPGIPARLGGAPGGLGRARTERGGLRARLHLGHHRARRRA